jgi:hypothetical protein
VSLLTETSWKAEFGLQDREAPEFFNNTGELSSVNPQAHLLQRGFVDLELDGILCAGNAPLAYFRCIEDGNVKSRQDLYRSFWNHGGAPVLVVVSDSSVEIYSGLTRPSATETSPGLVTSLDRLSADLPSFLLSLETGGFFAAHGRYFDPAQRVDRALLSNLSDARQELEGRSQRAIPTAVLDSLLCRLVFTAYLFDRGVIGESYLRSMNIVGCSHLRDVLGIHPTGQAKAALYKLFSQLALDFNGDLFADDLVAESKWIVNGHVEVLAEFFSGTLVKTGQQSFFPYDFGKIPVETISAIYEHFLKEGDKATGAFYTPRFLAEIVLDIALAKKHKLLGHTFLDPACGSGIFLVGLFNRLAQEWRTENPKARNGTIARELIELIRTSLFGVDVNPTACRIAAFSLYLAYLDQLSPRDIQQLQEKGRALPNLVSDENNRRNITCADFFGDSTAIPQAVSFVVGNPPWGRIAGPNTAAGKWSTQNQVELPDGQIAAAFIRKASSHVEQNGSVCFVLPAGVLFNHSAKAVEFQRQWVTRNSLECVLNLADYQRFLFDAAGYPAIVVRYTARVPSPNYRSHRIEHWSPKADWSVTKAEVIRIGEDDRASFSLEDLVKSLASEDAPQIWKRYFWASRRDRALLDRLSDFPRLRDQVRQKREKSDKPWIMGQGLERLGPSDDPKQAKKIELSSSLFIDANSKDLDLFLNVLDCADLGNPVVTVRRRSGVNTETFEPPHVLVSKGFSKIAFADFAVSFQHAIRGIHGPRTDETMLMFLAAYLRSDVARYYLFHSALNWGVLRDEVQDDELLRVPFPIPVGEFATEHRLRIVEQVAAIVRTATTEARAEFADRKAIVELATQRIEPLIDEYFGITESERNLIDNTIQIVIPSTRPTRSKLNVPTIKRSSTEQRDAYSTRVCTLLNMWSKRSGFAVRGQVVASASSGVAIAIFEKVERSLALEPMHPELNGVVETLKHVRDLASQKHVAIELMRGVKMFDRNLLYVVKPLEQRNWTLAAGMNDADEIAGSLRFGSNGTQS